MGVAAGLHSQTAFPQGENHPSLWGKFFQSNSDLGREFNPDGKLQLELFRVKVFLVFTSIKKYSKKMIHNNYNLSEILKYIRENHGG